MADAEEMKREKARNLRYKKAISKNMNLETIQEMLWEMQEECDNVRYYFETDDETLLNALDGDEDQEYEFKMMFADLCAECEQMERDMSDEYIPECFDTFFGAIDSGQLMGWDEYEGDYFGLNDGYEERWAHEENRKRMERMTKKEILDAAHICFKVAKQYLALMHRYDCLKAALDILRDENTGYLQMVKAIEEKYETAEKDGFIGWHQSTEEFDRLLEALPQMAWIQ
jgi:chromosome segregation ATPase